MLSRIGGPLLFPLLMHTQCVRWGSGRGRPEERCGALVDVFSPTGETLPPLTILSVLNASLLLGDASAQQ
eukprot:2371350-Pyramimonas_sp.AAC.1